MIEVSKVMGTGLSPLSCMWIVVVILIFSFLVPRPVLSQSVRLVNEEWTVSDCWVRLCLLGAVRVAGTQSSDDIEDHRMELQGKPWFSW